MVHELKHSMLARQTADDLARQRFVPELVAAGFPPAATREIELGKINGPGHWFAAIAEKPATRPARA